MITSLVDVAQGNCQIWVAEEVQSWFRSEYIDPDYVQTQLPNNAYQAGRATVIFYRVDSHRLVMRAGTRGGWMYRLLKDRYLRAGRKNRRSVCELMLLDKMIQMGLPVAEPIAAASEQVGIFYRYRLVTREISNARSLAEILQGDSLSDTIWGKVGETIARFHQSLIYHADLNASNIMLDRKNDIYLIDFDRGRVKEKPGDWTRSNLNRLRHSLEKLRSNYAGFHYDPVNFDRLMQGYSAFLK